MTGLGQSVVKPASNSNSISISDTKKNRALLKKTLGVLNNETFPHDCIESKAMISDMVNDFENWDMADEDVAEAVTEAMVKVGECHKRYIANARNIKARHKLMKLARLNEMRGEAPGYEANIKLPTTTTTNKSG